MLPFLCLWWIRVTKIYQTVNLFFPAIAEILILLIVRIIDTELLKAVKLNWWVRTQKWVGEQIFVNFLSGGFYVSTASTEHSWHLRLCCANCFSIWLLLFLTSHRNRPLLWGCWHHTEKKLNFILDKLCLLSTVFTFLTPSLSLSLLTASHKGPTQLFFKAGVSKWRAFMRTLLSIKPKDTGALS